MPAAAAVNVPVDAVAPGHVLGRLLLVVGAILVILAISATPALAHGGGGSDATNYRSDIDVVATAETAADPSGRDPVDVEGVTWSVLASDALLQVRNNTAEELLVDGYSGEPYLRVGPDGVHQNVNSPATYLNTDRFAQTVPPPSASADADPEWVKVADEPVYAWHDHRIHWMATTLPPQVKVDASHTVKVNDWTVPFSVDGQDLAVTGRLYWEPPPPWWPWILSALVAASVPVLFAFTKRDPVVRRRLGLQIAAAVFAIVIVINIIHGIDDLTAVPATAGQNASAAALKFLPLLVAAWATYKAARARPGAAQALLVGMFALAIPLGLTHTPVLMSSQVVSRLPEWFTRLAVASQFAVVGTTALAVLASGELQTNTEQRAADERGTAPAPGLG